MTQKELAKRINTTEATLSRYVSGDRDPKENMVANIATALHMLMLISNAPIIAV